MGRLVSGEKKTDLSDLFDAYEVLLLEALTLKSTPKKNANVLQHMMGYFKKDLSSDEKQELLDVIDNYRKALLPLIVPITLINHYVRKYDQHYLKDQFISIPTLSNFSCEIMFRVSIFQFQLSILFLQ